MAAVRGGPGPGRAGPDQGQGGKYLFVPPGYDGDLPDGYFTFRSPTYSNWIVIRALAGLDSLLTTRIYPLAAAADPPETGFVDFAGSSFNGIHSNDFTFFDEVNTIVQEEPAGTLDAERAGQLAAIGIVHGQPFTPDAHRRALFDQAAKIGAGLSRGAGLHRSGQRPATVRYRAKGGLAVRPPAARVPIILRRTAHAPIVRALRACPAHPL